MTKQDFLAAMNTFKFVVTSDYQKEEKYMIPPSFPNIEFHQGEVSYAVVEGTIPSPVFTGLCPNNPYGITAIESNDRQKFHIYTKEGLIIFIGLFMKYFHHNNPHVYFPNTPSDNLLELLAKGNDLLLSKVNLKKKTNEWIAERMPGSNEFISLQENLVGSDKKIRDSMTELDGIINPFMSSTNQVIGTSEYSDRVMISLNGVENDNIELSIRNLQSNDRVTYKRERNKLRYGIKHNKLSYIISYEDNGDLIEITHCYYSAASGEELLRITSGNRTITYSFDPVPPYFTAIMIEEDDIIHPHRIPTETDKELVIGYLQAAIAKARLITTKNMCQEEEPSYVNTIKPPQQGN